jgi:hypothetical protein
MVARNPNNTIDFESQNFGAPVSFYTIDGGLTLAGETNPGEALEAIIETVQTKGTVVAIGTEDGAGAFRVAVENSGWTASDLQTALQALGATVGANNYDASGATAVDFTF